MKIRKFNENETNTFLDYVKDCFLDIIEELKYLTEYEIHNNCFYISINLPNVYYKSNEGVWYFNKPKTIEEMVKYSNDLNNLYKDIEICFKKIKIKYPNIKYNIHTEYEHGFINDNNDCYKSDFDCYLELEIKE